MTTAKKTPAPKKSAPKPAPEKATAATATNTSAPATESADVSATGAAQAAPQAITSSTETVTSSMTTETTPPAGEPERSGLPTVTDDSGEPAPVKGLIIKAKTNGFRRAGRAWSTVAQEVDVSAFTDAQIEALLAEPELDIVLAV